VPYVADATGRGVPAATLARRGVLALLLVLAIVALLLMQYRGVFRSVFPATALVTDVGDGLQAGADVKLRGALVGAVGGVGVRPTADGQTLHAIDQLIRSSSSVAANYRSACRGKSKADFIAKLGIVEEESDEAGFWLEMLRDIGSRTEIRHSQLDLRTSQELARLLDEADQLVAIIVASRKTARAT